MDDAALARLKEVLAQHQRAQGVNPRDHGVVAIADLRALLAAHDALRAERDDLTDRLGNVKQQRDQARREATHWEYQAKAWSRHGRGDA